MGTWFIRFMYPRSNFMSHCQAQQHLPCFVCSMAPVCQSEVQLNGGNVRCGHWVVVSESLLYVVRGEKDRTGALSRRCGKISERRWDVKMIIRSCHSGVDEDLFLLGCYTLSMGLKLRTLRRNVMPPSSGSSNWRGVTFQETWILINNDVRTRYFGVPYEIKVTIFMVLLSMMSGSARGEEQYASTKRRLDRYYKSNYKMGAGIAQSVYWLH